MTDHLPALVFLVPLATAISMPVAGHRRPGLCRPLALVALCSMTLLSAASLWAVCDLGEVRYSFSGWLPPIGIEWVADTVTATMVLVVGALGVLCLVYARGLGDAGLIRGRAVPYYTIVLLLVSGLVGAIYAGDLFNVFVFLEVVSLSAYALVAVQGGRALVSAFRYLIMGALGTAFYLLGVGYFYAATGALNIADISQRLPGLLESKAVMGGLIFMFIGLAIKMALMPLHGWLPDAYADAPPSTVPLLAGLVTKIALLVWVRILYWAILEGTGGESFSIFTLVSSFGIVASIAAACVALGQRDLRRMFAYGGISHVGLVMIGVGQANVTGLGGSLYYLLNDAVMQCGLFVLAGILAVRYGVSSLDELGRARVRNPWLIVTFVAVGLGMVGLPPTGGFFGKLRILLGALEADNTVAAAAVVVTTLITLGYFAQVFEKLVRSGSDGLERDRAETPWTLRASMAALVAAIIGLGIWNDQVVRLLVDATGSLGIWSL